MSRLSRIKSRVRAFLGLRKKKARKVMKKVRIVRRRRPRHTQNMNFTTYR